MVRRRAHRSVGSRRERDGADRRRPDRPGAGGLRLVPARRSARTAPGRSSSAPASIEDANSDSNFCAYIATGVWHHVLVTGDRRFRRADVADGARAIDFVLGLQLDGGEICWARSDSGPVAGGAADRVRQHLPQHALRAGAGRITSRSRSRNGRSRSAGWATRSPRTRRRSPRSRITRWTGTTRSSAVRCAVPPRRPASPTGWDDFVVDGLGHPVRRRPAWVTGAETCELVLALDALGRPAGALRQFAAMQHLRERRRLLLDRAGVHRRKALARGADHLDRCRDDSRRRRAVGTTAGQRHLPWHRSAARPGGRLRLRVRGQRRR